MLILVENKLSKIWIKLISYIYKLSFHKQSGRFYMYPSVQVDNPDCIILEDGVMLGRRGWIYAIKSTPDVPLIYIKKGTKIYDNFHITCSNKLEIGAYCLINRNVLITDTIHNYEDITIPIISQGVRNKPTSIGDGSWVGNNSVIICSNIGKNCVISANTVLVNKDIPDFCVVAGNPGKIIKHYDPETKSWINV